MEPGGLTKNIRRKKKRKRTVITAEEIERLEKEFQKEPRPDRMTKMDLAQEMGKSENVVSTWFQNRRAREKRMARLGMQCSQETVREANVAENDAQPLDLSVKEGIRRKFTGIRHENLTDSHQTVKSPMFARLVGMAAAAEGGILTVDCPNINQAMMDACNGIMLQDARLVYHPAYGFDIENFES